MEVWKDIEGYEGLYQVSNLGRVKSLYRKEVSGNLVRTRNERILKLEKCRSGYIRILLYKDSVTKKFQVHRLVATSFLQELNGKNYVNHKNGIKHDNRLENLEWVTQSENQNHAYLIGLQIPLNGENAKNSKISESIAFKIKYEMVGIMLKEISKKYGISMSSICDIRKGRTWKHI